MNVKDGASKGREGFVGVAVLEVMRGGQFPTDDEAKAMDQMPLIDQLRKCVMPSDRDWLLRLVRDEEDGLAGLGVSLLKSHIAEPKVAEALEKRWESASPYLRNRLMWRLLDRETLSDQWQARFQNFVFDEWDTFSEFNRNFFGTGEMALPRLLSRIVSSSFPESKKWIYFCCIPTVVTNADVSRALIDLARERSSEATRSVIERLGSRI